MWNKLCLAVVAAFAIGTACVSTHVAAQGMPPLTGQVLEVLDVGAYTYLRLKTANGETWAAVAKVPAKKGDTVTIVDPAVMENFESPALKRTFPSIIFGTVGAPASGATTTAAAPSAPGNGPHAGADLGQVHGGAAKSADLGAIKVAKADGPDARTVAEVNANRLALKDTRVTIRAKVVKVNPDVMGKTWVHLRDGSGAASDNSNDLLITSKDVPNVGDIVVAKGVVKTDVALGAGYAYKVLVENVSYQK